MGRQRKKRRSRARPAFVGRVIPKVKTSEEKPPAEKMDLEHWYPDDEELIRELKYWEGAKRGTWFRGRFERIVTRLMNRYGSWRKVPVKVRRDLYLRSKYARTYGEWRLPNKKKKTTPGKAKRRGKLPWKERMKLPKWKKHREMMGRAENAAKFRKNGRTYEDWLCDYQYGDNDNDERDGVH